LTRRGIVLPSKRYGRFNVALQEGGAGAYAPPTAVIGVIERYRERGLPVPINAETIVRAGLTTESLAARTVQALKLLDLLDDELRPTAELVALEKVPRDQFKERLAEVLRTAYADVFKFVDPATDGFERIRDRFQLYRPPTLRDRMTTLFLGLSEYAGIIPEGRTKELTGRRPVAGRTKPPRPSSTRSPKASPESSSNGSGMPAGQVPQQSTKLTAADSRTLTLRSGGTVTLTVSVNLFELSTADRNFLLKLIDEMGGYDQEVEKQPQTT
jgi:hypothetical protein